MQIMRGGETRDYIPVFFVTESLTIVSEHNKNLNTVCLCLNKWNDSNEIKWKQKFNGVCELAQLSAIILNFRSVQVLIKFPTDSLSDVNTYLGLLEE